jgi:predicted nucleic acid-binding protein
MSAIGSVVLDTSVVIDYVREADPALIQKMDQAAEVYVALVVLGELLYGVHRSTNKPRTRDSVQRFMRASILLSPNEITADLYGRISRTRGPRHAHPAKRHLDRRISAGTRSAACHPRRSL